MKNNYGVPDATCKVVVGRAEAQVAPTTARQSVNATLLPNATLADVLHEYLCQSEEPLAVAYRQRLAQQQGEPCMESLTNGAPDATCKVVVGKAEAHVAPTTAGQSVNATVLPTALEDWLPSHTVERKLGISTRTLQTLRDNGTMPYTKLGGKIYYKRSDIQRILDDAYTMHRLKNPDGYGSIRK